MHNANLVIKTDVDQVIVASAQPSDDGGLPTIKYFSGSLEDANIRTRVCAILEGGERVEVMRDGRYVRYVCPRPSLEVGYLRPELTTPNATDVRGCP